MPSSNDSFLSAILLIALSVSILQGGRYLVLSLIFVGAMRGGARWIPRRRILNRRTPTATDYRREIVTSFRSVLIFGAINAPALWAKTHGWTLFLDDSNASLLKLALWTIALLILHDTWFYWTHRLMHLPHLFSKWHRTHHLSVSPTPFTAYAFDWREAIVQTLFTAVLILVLPAPVLAFSFFLSVQIFRNVWGHCGVELHPAGFADSPFTGFLTTTVHHQMHHAGGHMHNYGLYFTWWDRLMGTEHPEYRATFRSVTTDSTASRNEVAH